MLTEAAHEIEEAHHHHGLTSAVSVERHVGDDEPDSRRVTEAGRVALPPNPRSFDGPDAGGP